MLLFTLRRLLLAVPTLIGVSLVVFGLVHLAPGEPLYIQYVKWLGNAATGHFGLSVFSASPVWDQLVEALMNTFQPAEPGASAAGLRVYPALPPRRQPMPNRPAGAAADAGGGDAVYPRYTRSPTGRAGGRMTGFWPRITGGVCLLKGESYDR